MQFKISSISITNFRQYRGTHQVNFKFDEIKNVAIILGNNGAGKSNLLNAITWCFYGTEIHRSKDNQDSEHGMPIINTSMLGSLKPNQETYAEVLIQLRAGNENWTIKRRVNGGKSALGQIFVEESGKLTVVHPVGGQDKFDSGDDTQILINNLLPEALKKFFFIDGEQLREFFKVSTPEKIAEAVDIVSQLELVYKAEDHLNRVERALRKNVKATTPQLEQVQRRIELTQRKLDNITIETKRIEGVKQLDNQELIKVKDYLKNHSSLAISKLESERQQTEEDIKLLKKSVAKKESQRNNYLVDIAPFILLKETLEKSYKVIEDLVEKGDLPPKIKETFIRELLEKGRCICGTELGAEARKILEDYGNKISISELSEISIVGKTEIAEILADIAEFPSTIDLMNDEIEDFKSQLEKKEQRLEYISLEIQENNVAEIMQNEERRKELESLVAKNEQLLIIQNSDFKTLDATLRELKQVEDKELAKDKKNAGLKDKLSLVQNALKVLSDTESIIKSKIRKQVEKSINANFFRLIRKKSAFSSITIEENYVVKVHHKDGYNAINDLSAGEYLILGLAFMSSLMSISGFQSPVIIDTPLGKIDKEHREYITTELPEFLKGTQLILLVTPTEYDDQVKANLGKYLLKENYYQITENEDNTSSKVG